METARKVCFIAILKFTSWVFTEIQKNFIRSLWGMDTYVSDLVGAFSLETVDYQVIGRAIAGLDYNTVVIPEGGDASESLGENTAVLLEGFL